MNKIIPFNKDITFNDTIGEITSIALDDTLKLTDSYTIKGELIVRGCNKILDREEEFSYPLSVDITIDPKYDTSKCNVSIDDFYYEIVNDNILKVKIDLILDDLFYKEEPIIIDEIKMVDEVIDGENRDFNLDLSIDKAKEDIDIAFDLEKSSVKDESLNKIEDLFKETSNEKEYSIYRIYTMADNDTLDNVLEKYKITKEELEIYNDLINLRAGVKLIIPSIDE